MKKMERDTVFYKKLFELMIPIMLQNLMLALVAVADAFMLGGVDQNYMSAVSLATQIQFIQNMFLTAATASLGILGAQYWGKGDLKTLDDIFCMALRLCGLVSVVFFAACMFIPKYLMILFTNESVLIGYGVDYLRIAAFSYLLTGISQCYLVIMKTSEHAKTTAIISSFTVCINILLNAVFIYGWFGIAPMGVKGATLATAVCPAVTMSICGVHYLGRKNTVGFHWKRPCFSHLISCCKLGISAFVGEISSAVITIVFNMLILGIAGNTGVAAYGVIANMSAVAMSIFNGLAQGVQPLISENYGKNHFDRAKKLLKMGLCASLVMELAIVSGVWAKTDALIAVFNSEHNAALLRYAHVGLRLYFLGFLFAGINIMLVAYFSAVDNAKTAIAGSVSRGAVAIVVCAVLFAKLFGLNGVWISFLGSEMITCLLICGLARRGIAGKC